MAGDERDAGKANRDAAYDNDRPGRQAYDDVYENGDLKAGGYDDNGDEMDDEEDEYDYGDADDGDKEYDRYDGNVDERAVAVVKRFPLWDFPTRTFHWLLVCLIPAAWLSAELQESRIHELVGCSILVLVLFRVVWGFVGSRHSRYEDFLVGPRRLLAYIRGRAPAGRGHNPLGGWSVMVLLLLLFVQAFSGLFNSDDILFTGPFYYAVEKATRGVMGATHDWAFNLLLGFIALHIGAVLYHQFKHKKKIIQAMWRGWAPGREGRGPARSSWKALLILLVFAVLLWIALSFAPGPPPSPWDTY